MTDNTPSKEFRGPRNEKQEKGSLFIAVIIPLLSFLTPIGGGTQQWFDFNMSKFFYVGVFFLAVHYLLFMRNKFSMPAGITLWVAYLTIHTLIFYSFFYTDELQFVLHTGEKVLSSGFAMQEKSRFGEFVQTAFCIAFGYMLASEIRRLKQIISAALFYSLSIGIVFIFGGYTFFGGSGDMRMSGGALDPNVFGQSTVISFFCSLLIFASSKNKIMKWLSAALAAMSVIALILSASRGAFAGFLAGIFCLVAFSKVKRKGYAFFLLAITSVGLAVYSPEKNYDNIWQRLDINQIRLDKGSERIDLWKDYLRVIPEKPFFGHGFLRSMESIKMVWVTKLGVTHNIYIQLLVELGAIGFLLFTIAMYKLFKKVRFSEDLSHCRVYILSMIASIFAIGLFLNTLQTRDMWFVFGLSAAYINMARRQRLQIK